MSYHALPPDHLPAERTPSQIRWAEGERKYGARIDALLSDPAALADWVSRLRPASTSGGSASITTETPGPA